MSVHEIFKLIKNHRRKHVKMHAIICISQVEGLWIAVVIVIEYFNCETA